MSERQTIIGSLERIRPRINLEAALTNLEFIAPDELSQPILSRFDAKVTSLRKSL